LIWDVLNDLWDPRSNPSGFVSLGVAENALMHNELAAYINNIPTRSPLPSTAFTYGDGPTGSKRCKLALSRFLTTGLKPSIPITPSHLVISSGVTAAIEHCSWALCNPGQGILLGQPHYGAFIGDISTRPNVTVIPVPFGSIDPISPSCIQSYETALHSATAQGITPKALMLCNPHNPLGRCYSRPTLLALMSLCASHSLHLISDEIYAFSTWTNTTLSVSDPSPPPFTSILSIPPDATPLPPSHIHILWGLSKDFSANGLRLGVIISQANPTLLSAIRTVALHSAPSSLVEHVAATMLSDTAFTDTYIATNQTRLSESYTFITSWATKYNIPYTLGANAAFFLWCDFGAVWKPPAQHNPSSQTRNPSQTQTQTLTALLHAQLLTHKIFLASGEAFGSEKEGYFRIVFSQPRAYLEEGLRRIVVALGLEGAGGGEEGDMVLGTHKERGLKRCSKL
jgi:aspartate/methionine/tyrosine aminotransferase